MLDEPYEKLTSTLTIRKQKPSGDERDDDHELSQTRLGRNHIIQQIRPVFRCEDLVDAQERVINLTKVEGIRGRYVAPHELRGHEGGDEVDDEEEEYHAEETVHVTKHGELSRTVSKKYPNR
jgi:hypothetical protein